MTRTMHSLGRTVAVEGVSAGIGAVVGVLGVAGYRRSRDGRTGAGTLSTVGSVKRTKHVVSYGSYGDTRFDASRIEAMAMNEGPSTFAAGDEVGGDVIGEIHIDTIATSEFSTSIGHTDRVNG